VLALVPEQERVQAPVRGLVLELVLELVQALERVPAWELVSLKVLVLMETETAML